MTTLSMVQSASLLAGSVEVHGRSDNPRNALDLFREEVTVVGGVMSIPLGTSRPNPVSS